MSASHQTPFNQQIQLQIEDMSCGACSARVERICKKLEGVEQVYVNLATGQADITTNGQLDPTELIQKIEKAGYPTTLRLAEQHWIQLEIDAMTCSSCVGRVERIIKKNITDTETVYVNLANHSADFYIDAEQNIQPLLEQLARAGYPAQIKSETNQTLSPSEKQQQYAQRLRRDLCISLLFSVPIFLLEMLGHLIPSIHHWIMHSIGQHNSWLIQFVLCSLLLITVGKHFYKTGITNLLRGAPDMNSLVALGTLSAYGYSLVATFIPAWFGTQQYAVYYESASVIISLILLGRFLEARAKGKSSEAITHLMQLQPQVAHRVVDGHIQDVAINQLQCNDIVMIKPGEKVPTDGKVISGESYIDEAMMTGEANPVAKSPESLVIGGTLNQNGHLNVQVSAVGQNTVLANIIRLVEQAQNQKLPIQNLVNQITLWFVPIVITLAVLTFITWYLISPTTTALSAALTHAITVLIVACPCAMGLATPTSIMVGIGRAAELGIFFRHGHALQQLTNAQIIAFDKTGTLTKGKPILSDFIVKVPEQSHSLLQMVASLESASEHPIAYALQHALAEKQFTPLEINNFQAFSGLGVSGVLDGKSLYAGNLKFMQQQGIKDHEFQSHVDKFIAQGKSPIFFAIEQDVMAIFAVADEIKTDAIATIHHLKNKKLQVAMLSGDQYSTASHIGNSLNIDHVVAELLPHQKVEALTQFKTQYQTIAFVGDGINDAPALSYADIGIAIGTGTDIAIESADVVLMSGNVVGVAQAIDLSRATLQNIKQNLFWAFIYNLLLIPVAMGLFTPLGIYMSPMFAAAAMALSSVFVVSNALRLKRVKVSLSLT